MFFSRLGVIKIDLDRVNREVVFGIYHLTVYRGDVYCSRSANLITTWRLRRIYRGRR